MFADDDMEYHNESIAGNNMTQQPSEIGMKFEGAPEMVINLKLC